MYNTQKGKKIKIILAIIFLIAAIYWGLHAGEELNTNPKCDNSIEALVYGLYAISQNPLKISIINLNTVVAIGTALVVYAIIMLLLIIDGYRNKHYDQDAACGTAKWFEDLKQYNKKYTDPQGDVGHNGPNNMILTNDVFLNLDGHITRRNNNVVVVGGSGSGKTRYFIKPNILQANCNYVITDPKGDLLKTTGKFLESQQYDIKVFNLVEMWKSDCYNPFDYIRDDLGVVMMIKCLIKNTTPPGQKAGDPFWEKSEEALLQALCFYLVNHREKKYRNFSTVMKLLRLAEVDERNPSFKSDLDKLFDDLEKTDPNSIALKQYKTFKMGAGKTLKSILISCSVRLTVFNLTQIESLTGRDTIELEKMGEGKKALYVIIPSADSTYNFLVSMMYSQLFETLYFMAETKYPKNRLQTRVRFLLDEFANIGEIPEFTKKLATMRQYEISCSIILQNLAQIKAMYKDDWPSILGNCDSFLFLGGQEYETVEYISKALGKQTIISRDRSMSHGKSSSASRSFKTTSRELLTPDELIHLEENECVLMIRALDPFKGRKYDYPAHPNYQYTGDASDENVYVNRKDNRVIITSEVVDIKEEREKAQKYTKAQEEPSPTNRVIGDIKNAEGFVKSMQINNAKDLPDRFVPVELAPINPVTEEVKQNIEEDVSEKIIEKDEPVDNGVTQQENTIAADKQGETTGHEQVASETVTSKPVQAPTEVVDQIVPAADKETELIKPDIEQSTKPLSQRPYYHTKPSQKTLMKKEKISTGTLVIKGNESDEEIWDFDPPQ